MENIANIDEIKNIQKYIEDSVNDVKNLSDDIVKGYTEQLDELMKDININVLNADVVPDEILERYFLELTNAVYFIGSKSEFLGLYEDLSKSNAKIKYNQAYGESQIIGASSGKKPTVDDNRAYAETKSINDSVVSAIYSRSFRIVKSKVDGANEMIKTLSKIISKRMNERDYSDMSNPFDTRKEFN